MKVLMDAFLQHNLGYGQNEWNGGILSFLPTCLLLPENICSKGKKIEMFHAPSFISAEVVGEAKSPLA